MKDIRQRLLETFQVEHRDHLGKIRAILAELDPAAVRSTPGPSLDEAFRRAHSLKGAARAVDLRPVETLAHRLETLFSKVRDGSLPLDGPLIGVIQKVLDASEDWVAAFSADRHPDEPVDALSAIDQVLGIESGNVPQESGRHQDVSRDSGTNRAETPAQSQSAPGSTAASQPLDSVRVSAENLDRLLRSAGQLLTESLRQDIVNQELLALNRQITTMEKEWERVRTGAASALRRLGTAPEFSRISHYLDLLGRQLGSLSAECTTVRQRQQHSSWALRHLGEQLQEDILRARMVPIESAFEGFRMMMRDLGRDEGKVFEFLVTGPEVEADRMVLQSLKDPVMHLLRNAVSHGIESPEERRQRGKSPEGRIALRIEARGSLLLLTVDDDGRGIDLSQIAEVAVRRGLVSEASAATLSPREMARLIFQPGFSTARFITELAGRGMGLSVVYEAVAALQGEVEIVPKDEPGTRIAISVPLSLSTHRLLLVVCQDQTFGIPLRGIERLHRIHVRQVETVENMPVLNLHGQLIPIVSLAYSLGIGDPAVSVKNEILPVVVLKSGQKRLAVAVNALSAQIDALVLNLGPLFTKLEKVSGGILMGDGSVSLVLNPTALVDAFRESTQTTVLKMEVAAPEVKIPTILVVDDSITTRTLEKSILEAHGYRVRVAVDGLEALAAMRAEPVDLVIADIQMPVMDGFVLLGEIKKDRSLSSTPVIMVTSLESREDKERGMAMGADAYIIKRRFEQRELLETIMQII